MSKPIVLILAAGPGVGANAASQFVAEGYRVASASRSKTTRRIDDQHLHVKVDLSDPSVIPSVFQKVEAEFGAPPEVVITIAAARKLVPVDDPLSALSIEEVETDLRVNLLSTIAAAKEAVRGFKQLPTSASRTFIFTGNKLNMMSNPQVMYFGIGKSGAAKLIWDSSVAYREKGFKFYYVDERWDSGKAPREEMDPVAVAKAHVELAKRMEQGPWLHTFVKDRGYVDFSATDTPWDLSGIIEH